MGRGGRTNEKEHAERGCAAGFVGSLPTPSRGGRGDAASNDKARGPANALEDIMRRKGVDEAWCALEEMQRQNVTTDKYTVSRMLMKTIGDGRTRLNPSRIYRSIGLVERFIELQPRDVDEVLFNALLDTCCRLKDLNRLEILVNRMRELNVTPSPVTLGILVKAYGQAGDFQHVLQVWTDMEQQRSEANAVTYGCMIDSCVKCGHLEKAVEIFEGLRAVGKHKNTILYTTLIKGFGIEKDLPRALELFREMAQEGTPRNTITYNSIIEACIKNGDLQTAEGLLRELMAPEVSLSPDLITFSTLLKGYCHVGELDKALQVVEAIKSRGLRCDELVFNTLMDGCVKANDVSVGVGLFEEMVQSGLRPSAITHGILTRLYQRAGSEADAQAAVAHLYQHHGIERPAAGERGKGGGRRGGANRSPCGSPSGYSVSSGYGRNRERTDSDFSNWGSVPAMPSPSAPSTPLTGSPHGSPTYGNAVHGFVNGNVAPMLPSDAMRTCFVPPLPGTHFGDGTPCSQASLTPMGSLGSSACGSAYLSSSPCMNSQFAYAPMGTQMFQQMPPWPFAGGGGAPQVPGNCGFATGSMPPPPPNYPPGGEAVQQVMAAPVMHGQVAGQDDSSVMYNGPNAGVQQTPFSMPLSAPQDSPYNCQGQMMGQQPHVFFEAWPTTDSGIVQMPGFGQDPNQGLFLS